MWGCVISCNFLISTWVDIYNFLAFSSVFTVYKSFFAARMHPTVLEECGNENSMDWVWKYWLLLSLMFENIWFWFGTLTHILGGSSSHTWSDLKASVQQRKVLKIAPLLRIPENEIQKIAFLEYKGHWMAKQDNSCDYILW